MGGEILDLHLPRDPLFSDGRGWLTSFVFWLLFFLEVLFPIILLWVSELKMCLQANTQSGSRFSSSVNHVPFKITAHSGWSALSRALESWWAIQWWVLEAFPLKSGIKQVRCMHISSALSWRPLAAQRERKMQKQEEKLPFFYTTCLSAWKTIKNEGQMVRMCNWVQPPTVFEINIPKLIAFLYIRKNQWEITMWEKIHV